MPEGKLYLNGIWDKQCHVGGLYSGSMADVSKSRCSHFNIHGVDTSWPKTWTHTQDQKSFDAKVKLLVSYAGIFSSLGIHKSNHIKEN